jgi:hypothetical protein
MVSPVRPKKAKPKAKPEGEARGILEGKRKPRTVSMWLGE